MNSKLLKSFNNRTLVNDACSHFWTGAILQNGYGMIYDPETRTMQYAHRIAWEIANGRPVPDLFRGKPAVIMHTCDNKTCVTPHHLVLGNQQLNMDDKVNKGRSNPKRKYRGKALTEGELSRIHDLFFSGRTNYFISQETGHSQCHLSALRKKWREQIRKNYQLAVAYLMAA